jgi:hypothetical protein
MSEGSTEIQGAEYVNISHSGFYEDLKKLENRFAKRYRRLLFSGILTYIINTRENRYE